MALSYAEVAEILAIVDGSDLEELVLEIGETRLVVRKGAGSGSAGAAPVEARPTAAATHAPPAHPHAPPQPRAEPAEPGAVPVVSPMVGRLYRRPSPDEPPFVEEGTRVEAGQVIALIEVMKLFTQIEAPAAGTLVRFAVEDGGAVEYDQPLAWIRPD